MKVSADGQARKLVTEERLEGYALKDTLWNELQKKHTPVNGSQRKVEYTKKVQS